MARDDLGDQLSVQQQINKVIAQRQALMAGQTKTLGTQIRMAAELCKALDCTQLEGMNDRLAEIQEGLSDAADEAERSRDALEGVASGGSGAASIFDKIGNSATKVGLLAGALGGIKSALSGGMKLVMGFGKGIFGLAKSVGKLALTILAAPFKILENLVGMAQKGGGGGPNPVKVALEEIRKEMGDLNKNEAAVFKSSLKGLKGSMKDFGGTGKKMRKVFGRGRGGMAEFLKFNFESAKALGNAFSALSSEFSGKSAQALAVYRKGLGLSAEEFANLGKKALASGKSMKEYAKEVTKYAFEIGGAFGFNGKIIAKEMGKMMADFDHFGTLGPKVMASVAVQVRRLGIEVKEMAGVVDKFDNFEDAAKGASAMAQAFGMNIDAMKMMKEQDPSKRLSMMQKAFAATGKSVENMSRQELKLLSSQTGLSAEATKMAFSQRGLGMSYDDVQKKAAKSEKKQLTQAEAMKKLADSIERVFGSGGGGSKFKSFFDAFAKGFGRGIKRSKEFRKIMRNIRKSLKIVNRAGKRVGKAFVKSFPGVQRMFKGLQKLFDPKGTRKLMKGVVKEFKNFFKIVESDPKAGVDTLLKNLQEKFKKFFGSKGGAVNDIKEGGMRFLKVAGAIFKRLLIFVVQKITVGLNKIVELMRNPPGAIGALGQAFKDMFSAMGDLFGELFTLLGPPLAKALKKLFVEVWKMAKPYLMKFLPVVGKVLLGTALARMFVSVLQGGVVGKAISILFKGIGKLFGRAAAENTGGAPPEGQSKGFAAFLQRIADIPFKSIGLAILKLPLLAAAFIPAAILFAYGLVQMSKVMSQVPFVDLIKGLISFGASIMAIGHAAKITESVSLKAALSSIIKLPALALAITIGGVAFMMGMKAMAAVGMTGAMALAVVAVLGVMTLAVAAAGSMAWIASKIDPVSLVYALIALPLLALSLSLGVAAFAAGLILAGPLMLAAMDAAGGVDNAVKGFIGLAKIMGALSIAAIAAAVGGVAAIVGLAGLIPLAAFVYVMGDAGFLDYLVQAGKKMAKIDMKGAHKGFFAVAGIMGSLALAAASAAVAGIVALIGTAMLIGVALFVYTMSDGGFLDYIAEAGKKMGKVDMGKVSVGFLKTAVIMGAILLAATSAALAGVPGLVGAIMIVLGVFPFVAAVNEMIFPALLTSEKEAGKIKMKKLSKNFINMIPIFGSLLSLAVSAIPTGIAGLIGGFFIGMVGWFIGKVSLILSDLKKFTEAPGYELLADKKTGKSLKTLGSLFKVLGLAAKTSKSLTSFGLVSRIFGGNPIKNLNQMLTDMAECLLPGLKKMVEAEGWSSLTSPNLRRGVKAIALLMDTLSNIPKQAMKLSVFSGIASLFGMDIFATINEFATSVSEKLAPAANTLAKMKLVSPKAMKQRADMLNPLLDVMAKMAKMAMEVTGMDTAVFANADAAEKVNTAGDFLGKMGGSVKTLVTQAKKLVQDLDVSDMEKAAQMAPMLKAMAGLMRNMAPPPELFDAMRVTSKTTEQINTESKSFLGMGGGSKNTNRNIETSMPDVAAIGPLMEGTTKFMETMVKSIEKNLKPMMDAMTKLTQGELPDPVKLQTAFTAMKIIGDLMKQVSSGMATFALDTSETRTVKGIVKDFSVTVKGKTDPIATMASAMTELAKTMKTVLPDLIQAVMDATKKIPNDLDKVQQKMLIMSSAMKLVTELGAMMASLMESGGDLIPGGGMMLGGVTAAVGGVVATGLDKKAGGPLKRLFQGMVELTKQVQNNLPGLISSIMNIKITGDLNKMEKKIKVIVSAFSVVSTFGRVITDLMKEGKTKDDKGKESFDITRVTASISAIVGALAGDHKLIGPGGKKGKPGALKRVFKVIDRMARSIGSDVKGKGAKFKMVAEAFKVVSSFASAMANMSKLVDPPSKGAARNIAGFFGENSHFEAMVDAIAGKGTGKGSLEKIFDKIAALANSRPLRQKGVAGRMKTLSTAFTALASFASAMSDVANMVPAQAGASMGAKMKDLQKLLTTVTNALAGEDGKSGALMGIGEAIANLVGSGSGKGKRFKKSPGRVLHENRGRLKSLSTAFKALSSLASALSDLSNLGGGDPVKIKNTLGTMKSVIGDKKSSVKGQATITEIAEAVAGLAGKEGNLAGLNFRAATTRANQLRKALNKINAAVTQTSLSSTTDVTNILANVKKIAEIGTEVNKAPGVAKATFKGGKVTVQHKFDKINMNVTVMIDSSRLAKAVTATSIHGTGGKKIQTG